MKNYVNVSAANLYREATFHSEVDSQAVLWEETEVLEEKNDFKKVICEDGYRGWLNKRQLTSGSIDLQRYGKKIITQPLVKIYRTPDVHSDILHEGTAGGYLIILERKDEWLKTLLPDGEDGWTVENCCASLPEMSREDLLTYAQKFMGVPYYWGGKTPKGFDCSGFTQMIFKMFGFSIRRDARMQFDDAAFVSADPLGGKPADLLFFAQAGTKITHVGFSLGNGKILHARGRVRINSLRPQDTDFDPQLLQDFVEIRSFL